MVSVISPAPGLFANTAVQVSAAATDDASGVARLDVRFDGGEWQAMTLSDAAAGRFTASFPATQAGEGPHTFSVRAVDRAGNSDTTSTEDANPAAGTFVIDVTPPAIAIAGVAAGQVYQAAVRPVIAVTDASPLTTTALLNGAPFISGTEVSAAGPYTLAVSSTDAAGNAASATVSFTIQAGGTPPVAASQSVTTPEDTPAAIVLAAVDADGDALTFAVTVPPSHGTLSGAAPAVTYTPAPDFHGADQFTFTASDGTGVSAPAIVTIQVTPVNDPPVARVTAPASVSEGAAVVLNGAASADVDGDPLTYRWTQAGGPAVVLDLTNPAMPAFVAPEVGPPGAIVIFDLVVRDGTVDSARGPRERAGDERESRPDGGRPVGRARRGHAGRDSAGRCRRGWRRPHLRRDAPAHGTLSGIAPTPDLHAGARLPRRQSVHLHRVRRDRDVGECHGDHRSGAGQRRTVRARGSRPVGPRANGGRARRRRQRGRGRRCPDLPLDARRWPASRPEHRGPGRVRHSTRRMFPAAGRRWCSSSS